MKVFLYCLPVLLVSYLFPLLADATGPTAPSQKRVEQQTKQVRSQKTAIKTSKKKKNPVSTTFTPTEKIGADTVIAFPADI